MAKDPAFLFYSADASEDVSHMNRLERGAYFDFIQAQRKFHGITTEQARKILGKDFDEVWPALEMVLSCENDQYFIRWMRDGIKKRAEYAEKQRKRIQDYWDKKNNPDDNHGNTAVLPSENGIVIENEDVIKKEKKEPSKNKLDWSICPEPFREAFELWVKFKAQKGKKYVQLGFQALITGKIEEFKTPELLMEAVRFSMSNNWDGIFPPRKQPTPPKTGLAQKHDYEP